MTTMVREAKKEDLAAIMSIYESARRFMRSRGNATQWVDGYPAEELIRRDIASGHCFVGTDDAGKVLYVFAFIIGADPTYQTIEDGAWLNELPYGTIHRLASGGAATGVLRSCLDFCLEQIPEIRVDTHADNAPMRRAVEQAGFTRCGIIHVADGTPRIAYQYRSESAYGSYRSLRLRFLALANEANAAQMAAYMRNQFKFYGIKAEARKAVCKELIKAHKRAGSVDWQLLDFCFDDEHREFQYFVLDYLKSLKKFLTFSDIPRLYRYIKNKQWWDTIDGLDRVIGSIAFTDPRVNELMLEWSTDSDFWIRRVAIDHQIGRREKTDPQLLATILVSNFGSREFFINKAIGWSLREYSKTNPQWVSRFIERHRANMSSLSIREASKYL